MNINEIFESLTKDEKANIKRSITKKCKDNNIEKLYPEHPHTDIRWKELVMKLCGVPNIKQKKKKVGSPRRSDDEILEICHAVKEDTMFDWIDEDGSIIEESTKVKAYKKLDSKFPRMKDKGHKKAGAHIEGVVKSKRAEKLLKEEEKNRHEEWNKHDHTE